MNKNEDTIYQILWDAAKAVLRDKFVSVNAYTKENERSRINNLTFHPKTLEKAEQIKPTNRRKETIKIRAGKNETANRKQ